MNNRVSLVFSFLVAVGAYAGLLLAAPNVSLLASHAMPRDVVSHFRVTVQEPELRTQDAPARAETDGLVYEPSSIEDLLKWEEPPQPDWDNTRDEPAPAPEIEERIIDHNLTREQDAAPQPEQLAKVDAKIIEIAADRAREDINVERRLVRPSPEVTVSDSATPVLRSSDLAPGEDVLMLGGRLPGPGGDTQGQAGTSAESLLPDIEPMDPAEEEASQEFAPPEQGLPELPEELHVARRTIEADLNKSYDFEFLDDLVRIDIDTYQPPDEPLGYFEMRIQPGVRGEIDTLPKNVTLVIDASKSILQQKLDGMVDGAIQILNRLEDRDGFNVVVFRDAPRFFQNGLVTATSDNKRAARQFLRDLKAGGETDVYQAIRSVLDRGRKKGVSEIVLVMTDGRPTTGVQNARDIINTLTEENTEDVSIFAYGGGRTANRYLLDLLAYRNKGESHVTQNLSGIEEGLSAFFSRLDEPLLVDLRAEYGSVPENEVFPSELPDFFMDRPITVYGRYDPQQQDQLVMRLTGLAGPKQKELVFKSQLSEASTGNADIARRWALQKTYHIIGEICRVGERPELLEELRDLGRKYGIRTGYE